jgi:3alpha(or 20beta)-hydroxysteroid dehydrogenase
MTADVGPAPAGKLDGRIAIVTGAAQGTGAAIARRFVAEGARVLLGDVRVEQGRAVARELGEAAEFVELDVGNEAHWSQAVALAEEKFGGIDILINNAAVLVLAPLEQTSVADYERVVRVNQVGPFLGMRTVAPAMRRRGRGSIVNIGSTDGVFPGDQGLIAYGASKWALRGMTKIAALELARHRIRVNIVNPDAGNPLIGRPLIPREVLSDEELIALAGKLAYLVLPRLCPDRDRVDEIVPMVLLLASDDGSACTGGDYPVDGGYSAGMSGMADLIGL